MYRIISLLIIALLFFAAAAYPAEKRYVEGEVLVKYKSSVSSASKKALHQRHSFLQLRNFTKLNIHHLKLPAGMSVEDAVTKLKEEGDVEYAEPNFMRRPLGTFPNDPGWLSKQAAYMAKIGLPDAWNISQGSGNIIVAVIDTGVDYTHPDLAPNIFRNNAEIAENGIDDDNNGFIDDVNGWDFYYENNDNDPEDNDGHGTHVAGIIGAVGNNQLGVAGVNWKVRLMPLKFMEASGDVPGEVAAIEYAIKMGAKVINASYGDIDFSQSEFDAIKHAGDHGILVVAAAGNDYGQNNDGYTKTYPASYDLPNIISVAASDINDNLAGFSNYGPTTVHLAAPGVDITSTLPQGDNATVSAGAFDYAAMGMEFAGQTTGITRKIYNCGYGSSHEFPADVSGNIALIQRGNNITFKDKTINAQNAGAIAAIIYNNVAGSFGGTLGDASNWIPVVSISRNDGLSFLGMGNTEVTVVNFPYGKESGTSMATPFVAGTAALIMSERPNATMSEVKDTILQSVDSVPALSGKVITGGRLNVYKALRSVRSRLSVSRTVHFDEGWNFVSIPVQPAGNSIGSLLNGIMQNVKIVWSYDSQSQKWLKYNPHSSTIQPYSSISFIEADKGYWIYMDASADLILNGTVPSITSHLNEGWNLIGYSDMDNMDITQGLGTALDGKWSALWSWDNNGWKATVADSNIQLAVPSLTTLNNGKAYWIKIKSGLGQIDWTQ